MPVKISVLIPSRLAPIAGGAQKWQLFVQRAIENVARQSVFAGGHNQFECVVGVDPGMGAQAREHLGDSAIVAEARVALQAAALNAAWARASGEVIAILEDDDLWSADFLQHALEALAKHAFVSSNQLVVDQHGVVVRVLDFPTPSSWVTSREVFERIGPFDESYRWHIDNDWLGRVSDAGLTRAHMVEATAPLDEASIYCSRMELRMLLLYGGPNVTLLRHASPWPLVTRTTHTESGMAQIGRDAIKSEQSRAEYQRLKEAFGRVPW